VFSVAASGCTAEAHAGYPVAVAEVEVVGPPPLLIDSYPWYYYEGRTVYLVDGGWYYRDGPRWNRYRREPEDLAVRRQYIQAAPRAREERVRVQPARQERVRVQPARQEPARAQPARRQPAREQHHAERAQ
jgi:hypothetical protein